MLSAIAFIFTPCVVGCDGNINDGIFIIYVSLVGLENRVIILWFGHLNLEDLIKHNHRHPGYHPGSIKTYGPSYDDIFLKLIGGP